MPKSINNNHWKLALQGEYVRSQFLPALVEIAVERKRPAAVSYLGWILLELCLEKQVNPLLALREPVETLKTSFNMKINGKQYDIELSNLFFGECFEVIQDVIKNKKRKECENCQSYSESPITNSNPQATCSSNNKCSSKPSLYFWEHLFELMLAENIVNSETKLQHIIDVIKDPAVIAATNWGLNNNNRTVVEILLMLGGLRAIQEHFSAKTDNVPKPLFPPDLFAKISYFTNTKIKIEYGNNPNSLLAIFMDKSNLHLKQTNDDIIFMRRKIEAIPVLERKILHHMLDSLGHAKN